MKNQIRQLESLFDQNFHIGTFTQQFNALHVKYELKRLWKIIFNEELTAKEMRFISV